MAWASDVLIATGDPLLMEAIQSLLSDEQRISSATTAGEARVFLRSSVLDLIILDSALPDGRFEDIVALAEMLHVSIIAMAEHPREPHSRHPYLAKPFAAKTLLNEVRSVLEHHLVSP